MLPRGFEKLDVFAAEVKSEVDKSHDGSEPEGEEEKADYPLTGSFLVSGGYDGVVKVWSADDWQQVKSMTSDAAGKVMSVDVSAGESARALCPFLRRLRADPASCTLQMLALSLAPSIVGRSSCGLRPMSIWSREGGRRRTKSAGGQ